MNFTVYSKPGCTYCDKAKALLTMKEKGYDERILDVGQPNPNARHLWSLAEFKQQFPGVKTLPLILVDVEGINGQQVIGGFTELVKFLG